MNTSHSPNSLGRDLKKLPPTVLDDLRLLPLVNMPQHVWLPIFDQKLFLKYQDNVEEHVSLMSLDHRLHHKQQHHPWQVSSH